jgi:hypothetical protein
MSIHIDRFARLRRAFFSIPLAGLFSAALVATQSVAAPPEHRIQVAAYYFPNWHEETQPEVNHGECRRAGIRAGSDFHRQDRGTNR